MDTEAGGCLFGSAKGGYGYDSDVEEEGTGGREFKR
jgi:hypothetical protein